MDSTRAAPGAGATMAAAAPPADAWWAGDVDALAAVLGSGVDGLSGAEAARRLAAQGPNTVTEAPRAQAWRLLARQFASPLVLVLVMGAAVSMFLRDWADALIILAIVGGSTLLGFAQEFRASAAIASLRGRLALTVRVRRDGQAVTVPADTLVTGDVVELAAGNLVPADARVLQARDFLVTEASLTGESFPVEKSAGDCPAGAPVAQRRNAVFMGTSVRSGTATVLVTRTGRATEFGAVAQRLAVAPPEPEFARGVRHFGGLLLRLMVVIVLMVVMVNAALGRPTVESLLFAVALAVGLSPELLPAIVSVTLARGARAMAARGVLVRRLEAIEDLGSIDVLCTDKTGTLTQGTMTLAGALDARGADDAAVLRLAWLNASLQRGIDNPLDEAIVAALRDRTDLQAGAPDKVDEIPYDFQRRALTVVVTADGGRHRLVTKGAFTNVLGFCGTVREADGREAPLDDAHRARLEAAFRERGERGLRVLGLATREAPARAGWTRDDETGMCFEGFLCFVDPPKPQAAQTIRDLAARGIRVKMVTGDNRHVAAALAAQVGLDAGAMLTGEAIGAMRDEALWQQAPRTDLFVEVDPQQKERIVRALQRTGHAVGYLGDGINDAPALHAADVGISVDDAVDVARESADVVLLEPDLDVLRQGVEDGRRTFANTLKYIRIVTSANFGNMVSMAVATPFLPFLPMQAKQILVNNFLSDLPSIAISTDAVDPETVARPERWDLAGIRRFMVVFGLVSSAFDLLTFWLLIRVFDADQALLQTAWFVESLLTELAVLQVLRTRRPALSSRASPLLRWSTVAVAILALALPWLGPLAAELGFVPIPPGLLATLLGVVAAYVAATEIAKRVFYRRARDGAGKAPR